MLRFFTAFTLCLLIAGAAFSDVPLRENPEDVSFNVPVDPILGEWATDVVSWSQMQNATATFRRAASGVIGDYWYCFGDQYVATSHAFNLSTNQWSASTAPPAGATCNWPGVTTTTDLYTIGGYNPGYYNTVQKFTPTAGGPTGVWTPMAPLPRAACGVAAAWDGGDHIYAAGGNPTPAQYAYVYSISANTWTAIADLPVTNLSYVGGAFAGGKFHVIGGTNTPTAHYAYDPVTNTWATAAAVPTGISFSTFSVSNDAGCTKMYSIGGGGGYGTWPATNAVQIYNPDGDSWALETPLPAAYGTNASDIVSATDAMSAGGYDGVANHAETYRGMGFGGGGTPNFIVQFDYVSGSPVPAGGGNIVFDIYMGNASGAAQNFDAWLATQYGSLTPVTVVMRSFTNFQPGWAINRDGMFYPVPGSYAAGNYTFWARCGDEPGTVWAEDFFQFTKSGMADGITGLPNTWVNPFYTDADVTPIINSEPGTDAQWDVAWTNTVQTTVNDNQCLGAEFDGTNFWVTGGANALDPNKLYKLTSTGTLVSSTNQWSSNGWGWRDMAYDGTYLYASDDLVIDAINPVTVTAVPAMTFTGPVNPARALAYDPVLDHFWAASFSTPIYEFNRAGSVIWSGSSGLAGVYGMAWDDDAPDGPWLWIFDQSGTPATTFKKFNPTTHTMTTESHTVALLPGSTDQIAGGAFFSTTFNPNFSVLGGITQGTPNDMLFALEMYGGGGTPNFTVDFTYVSGSPVPAGGGNIVFNIYMLNGSGSAQNFDAWLAIQFGAGAPTTVVMRSFTNFQAGWAINRSGMFYPIPGSYAAGSYTFWARCGDEPATVWAEDSFPFTKSGMADGSAFVPFAVDGAPNPFDEIIMDNTPVISEFALQGAYPNPFNPVTTISFSLVDAGKVELSVYDVNGREVAQLVNGYRNAGAYTTEFDGSALASGVYFAKLSANGQTAISKMVLMK